MVNQSELEERPYQAPIAGWKNPCDRPSLPGVFRSIRLPESARWIRRFLAFVGPGYLVAVGYMDPGNWATDLAAGSAYNYRLLSVVLLSSLLAMFLQTLSARLGIVTGRDLAQACRDAYPKPLTNFLWLSAEVAIVACDVAEVLGAAIALNLLFHLPLIAGVVITALDVLLILGLQNRSFRFIEILVITLIVTMIAIFGFELALSGPAWRDAASNLIPRGEILHNRAMLYVSLGILGATVMPHNLYLHSSIVQTRDFQRDDAGIEEAVRLSTWDSAIALTLAFFVNAAILLLAASAFHAHGKFEVASIQEAYKLLNPLLGATLATPLFAVALLASGQNSTITGTMAGQVVLEGFTRFHLKPWARRLISRLLAIVPAIVVIASMGESGVEKLLLFSQVVLSAQLVFAVWPLVQFTSDEEKMGRFVSPPGVRAVGWISTFAIGALNVYLIALGIQGG